VKGGPKNKKNNGGRGQERNESHNSFKDIGQERESKKKKGTKRPRTKGKNETKKKPITATQVG